MNIKNVHLYPSLECRLSHVTIIKNFTLPLNNFTCFSVLFFPLSKPTNHTKYFHFQNHSPNDQILESFQLKCLPMTVLTLYPINTHFEASTRTAFENIVGKEEIAHNEQFLLFPSLFSTR